MTKSEMVLSKTFSAQWLMAVLTTSFACIITLIVVLRKSPNAEVVVPLFFSAWSVIMTHYFKRDRVQDATNVTSTETKTVKVEPEKGEK